ncbi:MAG: TetR/AcrR family transcriptional regulator [Planctomycetota bacterium]
MRQALPRPGHRTRRLSKADWLAEALDLLMERGVGAMKVRTMAASLGVTLGSFYWHFEDLADFKRQLLAHWRAEVTDRYIRDALASAEDPSAQLLNLMSALDESRVARYEAVVRAWAQHERGAREAVEAVDRTRLDFLHTLFRKLGFRGVERELRARLFLHYQLSEPLVLVQSSPARRRALRKMRHAFLTSPAWPQA